MIPSIWAEDIGRSKVRRCGRIKIFSPLHSHGTVKDGVILDQTDVRLAWSARQRGVCKCIADIEWDGRI
jgi:hypothetical protein